MWSTPWSDVNLIPCIPQNWRHHAATLVAVGCAAALYHASAGGLRPLARKADVSPSFVSQIENGKSQPSVATLYAFAQLLDVSIDETSTNTRGRNSTLENAEEFSTFVTSSSAAPSK